MLGSVIAWMIMEPTPLMPESHTVGATVSIPYEYLFVIGLLSGLFIGAMMGLAEGLSGLSTRDLWRSVWTGALVGAAGGILGLTFGNTIYSGLERLAGGRPQMAIPSNLPAEAQPTGGPPGPVKFLLLLIGRGFGWALIGGFIGISQGIATSSSKKMANGAIGGLIGGALGGSVFEIMAWLNVGQVTNFPAWMVRFISFAITGGAIGLFIGFIEEVAKKAWLRRLIGNNEGPEHVLFKPVTVIGRSEFVEIPVYTDPDVGEKHAAIKSQGNRHLIEDLGSYSGTLVNGKNVTKELLSDGDVITIGKTRFLYRDKATARSGISSYQASIDPRPAIPTSQHVCPFCGSVKDANGKCECSVGSSPQASGQTQAMPSATQMGPQPLAVQDPFAQPAAQQVTQQQPVAPAAPQAVGSGAKLVATGGPYSGQTFVLKPGETFIGREATKDIGLPTDNTVSRNHARVVQEMSGYVIHDDGSTNGTFVNGQRITRHELANNDIVQVGSSKFRFEA